VSPSHPGWSAELPERVEGVAKPEAAAPRADESAPIASIAEVRPLPEATDPPSPSTAINTRDSQFEQAKTILAAIGLLAIVFHGLRMLAIATR
jgi:hypothetical protein